MNTGNKDFFIIKLNFLTINALFLLTNGLKNDIII